MKGKFDPYVLWPLVFDLGPLNSRLVYCSRLYGIYLSGYALGIWYCRCSVFYKRELWASKSAGAHSTKSLKISGCKRSQRSVGWRNLASDEALGNRCFTDSNLQYIADSFCGLKCSSHTCKRPLYVGHCRGWLNFWIFLPFEPHWDSNRSITSHEQMNFWEDCCIHWLEPWKKIK